MHLLLAGLRLLLEPMLSSLKTESHVAFSCDARLVTPCCYAWDVQAILSSAMDGISAEQRRLCATSRVFTNGIQHVGEDGEVAEELS